MEIKKHDTFFQWRKDRKLAPILLEVRDIIENREGYRGIYKVRWHILETDQVYPATFPMAVDNNGMSYEFVPIPRKVYRQAMKILKETSNYKNARRRILYLIKKDISL
ncbi:MAG: hypothetical protein IJ929_00820 [Prevotella sp.]|nr:hypothetical protein [Prevotella sp.]